MNHVARRVTACFLFFTVFSTATNLLAERLDVSEGTMAVKGTIGLNYGAADINELGSVAANFDLTYSYFLIDSLAASIGLRAKANVFGAANALQPTIAQEVGLLLGTGYYADLGNIFFPYGQLTASIDYQKLTRAANQTAELRSGVTPAVGVLIGLNRHVAIDLGVDANFSFPLVPGTRPTTQLTARLGYLGVAAFF